MGLGIVILTFSMNFMTLKSNVTFKIVLLIVLVPGVGPSHMPMNTACCTLVKWTTVSSLCLHSFILPVVVKLV